MTSSQLPQGMQTFFDSTGTPLVGGSVSMYAPGTLNYVNTWQDPSLTTLNTNPILLDSAGRCKIYGTGQYRQIVQDSLGNTIWDQLTDSPDVAATTTVIVPNQCTLEQFGGAGDSITLNDTAYAAAQAYMTANYISKLQLGVGTYNFSNTININTSVTLQGVNKAVTLINVLNVAIGCVNVGINATLQDVSITSPSARSGGASVTLVGNYATIKNCDIFYSYYGIVMGQGASSQLVRDVVFSGMSNASGSTCIQLTNFNQCVIDNVQAYATPGQGPTYGIVVQNGSDLKISNADFNGCNCAFICNANSLCTGVYVVNSVFNYGSSSTAQIGYSNGPITGLKFTNCIFSEAQAGSGMLIGNNVDGVCFTNCDFLNNSNNGLYGTNSASNISVTGGFVAGVETGYYFDNSATLITITGTCCGPVSETAEVINGAVFNTGCNGIICIGNNFTNATNSGTTNLTGSSIVVIANNTGLAL